MWMHKSQWVLLVKGLKSVATFRVHLTKRRIKIGPIRLLILDAVVGINSPASARVFHKRQSKRRRVCYLGPGLVLDTLVNGDSAISAGFER